jgi:imidazolonepropionase-like amidohydrolase
VTRLILTQATVIVGDGTSLADAHVVVDDDRITAVGPGSFVDVAPQDRVVDLGGRVVMPGMVNCHFHATYHNLGSVPAPFGLEEPMALQTVRAVNSLGLLVNSGFTSAVSAGAPFAIDASMKVAIEKGLVPGPRLVPCSRDVSTTGHAGDRSYPSHWQVGALGAIRPSDGPDDFRRSVRAEIKEGAEMIKMFVTGGHGTIGPREQLEMTREEMAAGIEAAHLRGVKVRGHIANREAIMMALDLDIDIIDHGDGLDGECIERLVESGTPLVPSMLFGRLGLVGGTTARGQCGGRTHRPR